MGYVPIPSPSFEAHINIRTDQMSEGHTPKQSLKMHAVDLGKVLGVCAWGGKPRLPSEIQCGANVLK